MNNPKKEAMRAGGKIAAKVLAEVLEGIKPGVSPKELDQMAEKKINAAGAAPSFKGFKGYPFATCVNINESVVHGLPTTSPIIKRGDLVTIDLGVYYQGFHTDTAKTIQVQSSKFKVQNSFHKFLETGQRALKEAIDKCRASNHLGDIGWAIQETVEGNGFFVIRELVGHGIGKKLHEEPSVPGYGKPNQGEQLKAGMALAVEVIYAQEETELERLKDEWTLVARAGCPTAMFEHTVLVTRGGPIVLTRGDSAG